MLRTFETKDESYKKFKEICTREGVKIGDKLNEFIIEYIKVHGEGNPVYPLDKWQDQKFKAFPAFMERMTTTWNPYLDKCDEKELKEIAEHAEAILNKAIDTRRRL